MVRGRAQSRVVVPRMVQPSRGRGGQAAGQGPTQGASAACKVLGSMTPCCAGAVRLRAPAPHPRRRAVRALQTAGCSRACCSCAASRPSCGTAQRRHAGTPCRPLHGRRGGEWGGWRGSRGAKQAWRVQKRGMREPQPVCCPCQHCGSMHLPCAGAGAPAMGTSWPTFSSGAKGRVHDHCVCL